MTDNQTSPRRFSVRNISWLTAVLAFLAVATFIAISGAGRHNYITPMGYGVMESRGGTSVGSAPPMPAGVPTMEMGAPTDSYKNTADSAYYPYPYPYPNPDVPVTDTREYLKVNYNASIRTRDVQGLTRRVETTVRGYGGRIDQESSTPQYGYVSFAVSQGKYEAFRNEVESFVSSRFLSVNISSQNLLSQKVSIEDQKKQADSALSDFQAARQKLVNAHASAVKTLQAKIDADVAELASLRAQPATPEILAKIQTVTDDWTSLKKQLANENASYTAQLNNADANIKYAKDVQSAVATQDQKFLDNIATVTGTISIQWISLSDMVQAYLPGYWIPIIFAVLALLSFQNDRRRFALAAGR